MNMTEKTEKMKKYILMNNIVIAIQFILVILSVVFNFLFDDIAVFVTVFIHIVIFVLYNSVAENIIDCSYLRKKYAKICSETHYLQHIRLKMRMYKASKTKKDTVSEKLIVQSAVKVIIAVLNILMLLLLISFE